MRFSVVFMSAALCLGVGTQAVAATPLVNANMGSDFRQPDEDEDVQLVKKKRSSDGDSGERTGLFDYLKASFDFDIELHDDAKDGMLPAWLLGALFNALGGNIWAPMIFYKDVPDSDAKSTMMTLGILSTVLYWIPGVFPFIVPGAWFWGIGIILFLGWTIFLGWFVFPRAIAIAASDAYSQGGGSSSKKKKKKKKVEEDEDDDE